MRWLLPNAVMIALFFFFQAEDGIRDLIVTGVQTCALPICSDAAERTDMEGDDAAAPHARDQMSGLRARDGDPTAHGPVEDNARRRGRRREAADNQGGGDADGTAHTAPIGTSSGGGVPSNEGRLRQLTCEGAAAEDALGPVGDAGA